jgi:pimeloyl-ACP methyl ester carboxylesterase
MTPEVTDMIYRASFSTLPGVRLKRIDDAAHFVFLDQPAAFNAELDAFLAR